MGYETKCRVRVDDRSGTIREADGTVLLETDELIVRGDARVGIPRASIERVATRGGVVTVTSPTAIVSLTLGADVAVRWHKKLEEPPKRLIDKLDVKPNAKVWACGIHDEMLITQLQELTTRVGRATQASDCDVVLVGVDSEDQLDRIQRALGALAERGAFVPRDSVFGRVIF